MGRRKLTKAKKRKNLVKLIVQDNRLVEADYFFDTWETRFFYTIVSMIDKNDPDDKVYRVWYSDIKKLFNLGSNKDAYKYLREAAESILSKSVKIKWNDEGGTPLQTSFTLFTDVTTVQDGFEHLVGDNKLYIDIGILEKVRPFFLDVKKRFDPKIHRYTSYDVRNIIPLKPYGTRIYELLKQYQKIGERTLLVSRLKNMFNITDEYPRFYDFYKYVINKSIKDINKHTDLNIPLDKIEKIKKGRTVHAVRFIIEAKPQKEIDLLRGIGGQQSLFEVDNLQADVVTIHDNEIIEPVEEEQETETDRLYNQFEEVVVKKYGITPVKFVNMLSTGKYNEEAIKQAINVTNRAKYNQEIRKSVAGFFMSALKEGYTDAKEEAKKQTKDETKFLQEKEKIQKQLDALQADYTIKVHDRIREITAAEPSITETALDEMRNQNRVKQLISKQEIKLGRKMEIEDFRKSTALRGTVVKTIIKLNKTDFSDIQADYEPKIQKLNKQLTALQKGM